LRGDGADAACADLPKPEPLVETPHGAAAVLLLFADAGAAAAPWSLLVEIRKAPEPPPPC
ncbi:hypothetical protein Dimus_007667, partial [Dionaea muscipula]